MYIYIYIYICRKEILASFQAKVGSRKFPTCLLKKIKEFIGAGYKESCHELEQ